MRGAPQRGLSRLIVRISSRTSFGTAGRSCFPRRIFPVQNRRKPLRCDPTIVDAFRMNAPDFQSGHAVESRARRSRSAGVSFGRFTERCRTSIGWRNARISNWSPARLRKEADTEAIRAVNVPEGNRTMSDNAQSISAIGVYGNHSCEVRRLRACPSFVRERYAGSRIPTPRRIIRTLLDPVAIDLVGKGQHLDHILRSLESGPQSVRGLP
jgi:hypothetical protein